MTPETAAVVLALLCAAAYGASDFIGGVVSRRSSAWPVAFVVQSASAASLLLAAPFVPSTAGANDLAWGVAAGLGSGVGVSFLFRGFAAGRMSVVAPLSGVGAAVLPVLTGLALGERFGLLVLLGLVVAIPGIWLVSAGEDAPGEPHPDSGPARQSPVDNGVLDGLLAGVGFAVTFIGLGQVSEGAGLWPLVATQLSSMMTVPLLALAFAVRVFPVPRSALRAWYAGPFSAAAGLAFYLATTQGLLSVAAVLASLYPAVTILLAVLLLRERIGRGQVVGLLLCGVCVTLVTAG